MTDLELISINALLAIQLKNDVSTIFYKDLKDLRPKVIISLVQ